MRGEGFEADTNGKVEIEVKNKMDNDRNELRN